MTIPEGAEADQQLARALLGAIARVRWGEEGYYRISAVLDPEVDAARRELGNAASILAGGA